MRGRTVLVAGLANKVEDYSAPDQSETTVFLGGLWGTLSRKRVEEALRARTEDLERFYRAGVGRETRMIALKQEISELCTQACLTPRYPSVVKKP